MVHTISLILHTHHLPTPPPPPPPPSFFLYTHTHTHLTPTSPPPPLLSFFNSTEHPYWPLLEEWVGNIQTPAKTMSSWAHTLSSPPPPPPHLPLPLKTPFPSTISPLLLWNPIASNGYTGYTDSGQGHVWRQSKILWHNSYNFSVHFLSLSCLAQCDNVQRNLSSFFVCNRGDNAPELSPTGTSSTSLSSSTASSPLSSSSSSSTTSSLQLSSSSSCLPSTSQAEASPSAKEKELRVEVHKNFNVQWIRDYPWLTESSQEMGQLF